MNERRAEGVLLTGVYGSGKSSVAEEIAYLLEQRGEPYALLDLDYLSWGGTGTGNRASEFGLMVQNLADVAANYRRAGIRLFVLAYFVRSPGEVGEVRKALGLPLRVARLTLGCRRSNSGWAAMSPAAAATTCGQRRNRSRPPRERASRTWSSATTVPSGWWRRM